MGEGGIFFFYSFFFFSTEKKKSEKQPQKQLTFKRGNSWILLIEAEAQCYLLSTGEIINL